MKIVLTLLKNILTLLNKNSLKSVEFMSNFAMFRQLKLIDQLVQAYKVKLCKIYQKPIDFSTKIHYNRIENMMEDLSIRYRCAETYLEDK